ncbi:unnamed protein product [Vicia faba]|uniref:Uncharacterized protein n=1 Tax=Vicia faba TaxID=3906 RepID=A0AAV1A669_VICFA|nr:unnamed protein product [Vicia faba]CAI8604663.1 unnamed protein product [Vicia faba]
MQRIPSTSIATVRPPTGGDEQHVGPTHLEQPRQESAQAQELASQLSLILLPIDKGMTLGEPMSSNQARELPEPDSVTAELIAIYQIPEFS